MERGSRSDALQRLDFKIATVQCVTRLANDGYLKDIVESIYYAVLRMYYRHTTSWLLLSALEKMNLKYAKTDVNVYESSRLGTNLVHVNHRHYTVEYTVVFDTSSRKIGNYNHFQDHLLR